MYLFAPNDRAGFDDWRPAVHDSLGLSLRTGRDERLWRPLANPRELQVSAFSDTSPRGFGLMQRQRAFADFQDLESRYERRPSAWIEPIGDWAEGAVHLVEIPSDREINDNIVAFWRPKEALRAKGEYLLNYRLHWCWSEPGAVPLATVGQTRCGLSWDQKNRQFVIDFTGDALKPFTPEKPPALDIACDKGRIVHANVQTNPDFGGWRVSIQHDSQGNKVVELRARLLGGEKPVSETWVYRWTPS
jgi:glucans biosynthesis protein